MKLRDLTKIMNLNQDLINIFTDYAFALDYYFQDDNNKEEHKILYEEYKTLHENIKRLEGKYKL